MEFLKEAWSIFPSDFLISQKIKMNGIACSGGVSVSYLCNQCEKLYSCSIFNYQFVIKAEGAWPKIINKWNILRRFNAKHTRSMQKQAPKVKTSQCCISFLNVRA